MDYQGMKKGTFWRKRKRILNWYLKKAAYGKYVIDCRYHPCRVTEVTFDRNRCQGDCTVISLITETPSSCDFFHCGVEPISESKAFEMAAFAKANTWNDYLEKYHGYSDEELKHYDELNKVWNFEQATPRQ